MTSMTYSGDNYPGHLNAEVNHIAAIWEAPEDVLRAWFSGELPETGAMYGIRAVRVYDCGDGKKGVELQFARL